MEKYVINQSDISKILGHEFEVVNRYKNGKFKEFTKIILNNALNTPYENEVKRLCLRGNQLLKSVNNTVQSIDSNVSEISKVVNSISLNMNFVKGMQLLNATVGISNFCMTVAGFSMVLEKLNAISQEVQQILELNKVIHEENTLMRFQMVIEEYTAMLDGKEGGVPYSETKYRELISSECIMLDALYRCFINQTCTNNLVILQAIISLSAMASFTITDFDTIYYYNHPDKNDLYAGHQKWMNSIQQMLTSDIKKELEDIFFIDEDRNQYETILLVEEIRDEFQHCIDVIETNVDILNLVKDNEEYDCFIKQANDSLSANINNLIQAEDKNNEEFISMCKRAKQIVGLEV